MKRRQKRRRRKKPRKIQKTSTCKNFQSSASGTATPGSRIKINLDACVDNNNRKSNKIKSSLAPGVFYKQDKEDSLTAKMSIVSRHPSQALSVNAAIVTEEPNVASPETFGVGDERNDSPQCVSPSPRSSFSGDVFCGACRYSVLFAPWTWDNGE